jgi:DNA repair protein RadC
MTGPLEIRALGAATLPTRDLLRVLLRRPVDDGEIDDAARALALVGPAREAALLSLKAGPQLLAAVELGRRAWMLPSPQGRRIKSPVDVAAVIAPRADDDELALWVLSLDVRLSLARLERVRRDDVRGVLRSALGAGCQRVVVASRRAAPAVPDNALVDELGALVRAAAIVGVTVVDRVILGDDGFCSLLRTGLLPPDAPREPRYR